MLKVFLVEDEFVMREGTRIILTGLPMVMNFAGKQAMGKLPIL